VRAHDVTEEEVDPAQGADQDAEQDGDHAAAAAMLEGTQRAQPSRGTEAEAPPMEVDAPYLKRRRPGPDIPADSPMPPNRHGLASQAEEARPDLRHASHTPLSPHPDQLYPGLALPSSPRAGSAASTTSSLTSAGASPPPTRRRRCGSDEDSASPPDDGGPHTARDPGSSPELSLYQSSSASGLHSPQAASLDTAELEAALQSALHDELRDLEELEAAAMPSQTPSAGEPTSVTASRLAADQIAAEDRADAEFQEARRAALAEGEYQTGDYGPGPALFAFLHEPAASGDGSPVSTAPSTDMGSDWAPADPSISAPREHCPEPPPEPPRL
jgi:hypothetical protein